MLPYRASAHPDVDQQAGMRGAVQNAGRPRAQGVSIASTGPSSAMPLANSGALKVAPFRLA